MYKKHDYISEIIRNNRTNHTLRRFANISAGSKEFKEELEIVKINLGEDYLNIIKKRLGSLKNEVIILSKTALVFCR